MVWLIKWSMIFVMGTCSFAVAQKPPEIHFDKKKIKIKKQVISVEVAESYEQHERGLMFRPKLAANDGMIFVFTDELPRNFWMKNTLIDLSIGYFDKNRKLKVIIDMPPCETIRKECPSYPSIHAAQYALEMNKGWFEKNGIKVGDQFNWD